MASAVTTSRPWRSASRRAASLLPEAVGPASMGITGMPNANRPLRGGCYTRGMKIEKYGGTASDVQELLSIRDGIGALLESHAGAAPLTPRADLYDLGEALQLHLEVPGVQLADLEIGLDD